MMRIFIAIELPKEIKKELLKMQGNFQQIRAKWVRPEHMHLTLVFLGDVDESRIMEIQDICHKVAKEFEPFEIELSGLGAFPDLWRAHTLWIGIKNSVALNQLQKSLSEELKNNSFQVENRPFIPHLTLARFKKRLNLKNAINKFAKANLGKIKVAEFIVFESKLLPQGPKHKIIKNIKLT